MKICRTFLFLLFAILLSSSVSAQLISTFDLTIFKPLPEVDLGALSMANDLSGAPKVFQISILPAGIDVYLEGEIRWTDIGKTSSQLLFDFKTKIFKSTTFFNTDLGSTEIRIARTNSNNNVINDIVKRGKPVGKFEINLTLRNPAGVAIKTASDFVEFINPTQSFTILTPTSNSELQQGNIIVSWIQVPGADHYKIRVNNRKSSSQSFEEALSAGNPYIDFEQRPSGAIPLPTSYRLSDIPNKRPIEEGQEYVIQVSAVLVLPSGNKELPSDIVNFSIAGSNDARDNAIKNQIMSIAQSLPGGLGATLINLFANENLRIKRLVDEKGNPISEDQLKNLLIYLNANPDKVISALFISK